MENPTPMVRSHKKVRSRVLVWKSTQCSYKLNQPMTEDREKIVPRVKQSVCVET